MAVALHTITKPAGRRISQRHHTFSPVKELRRPVVEPPQTLDGLVALRKYAEHQRSLLLFVSLPLQARRYGFADGAGCSLQALCSAARGLVSAHPNLFSHVSRCPCPTLVWRLVSWLTTAALSAVAHVP